MGVRKGYIPSHTRRNIEDSIYLGWYFRDVRSVSGSKIPEGRFVRSLLEKGQHAMKGSMTSVQSTTGTLTPPHRAGRPTWQEAGNRTNACHVRPNTFSLNARSWTNAPPPAMSDTDSPRSQCWGFRPTTCPYRGRLAKHTTRGNSRRRVVMSHDAYDTNGAAMDGDKERDRHGFTTEATETILQEHPQKQGNIKMHVETTPTVVQTILCKGTLRVASLATPLACIAKDNR